MTRTEVSETLGRHDLSVGISDLLAHRECGRRAAYGARRHTGKGTQNHQLMTPEARDPGAAFGSLVHDAIEYMANGFSQWAATDKAWATWGGYLEPSDLDRLEADLEVYRKWEPPNAEPVLVEGEIRVPLTLHEDGRPIWFRGRIDRLYRSTLDPSWYIHVDYKSSKWLKTQREVDEDPQMWAYNWALHEYFPEIEHLEQIYQQFEGEPVTTRKNDDERRQVREWLGVEARNYFAPAELMDDGLPEPDFNHWCPWCPILESCQVVPRLSAWALSRINELAPEGVAVPLSNTPIEEYIEQFEDVQTALKVLKRFEGAVKGVVREVTPDRQAELGFKVTRRKNSVLSPMGKAALLETLGEERFLLLASISQEALKDIDDDDLRNWAKGLYEKSPGAEIVTRKKA